MFIHLYCRYAAQICRKLSKEGPLHGLLWPNVDPINGIIKLAEIQQHV